jgi:hypothetical protein
MQADDVLVGDGNLKVFLHVKNESYPVFESKAQVLA